jgi:selenium metabolism protein YedF
MACVPAASSPDNQPTGTVVLVTSDTLGSGPQELGQILLRAFVRTLKDAEPRPTRLLFLNNGVLLTTEGSYLLDELRGLEEAGVELLSCGPCLDYFQIKDRLRVGRVSNMQEIVGSLSAAARVIHP